ncbi:hypothetical protein ET475_10435 [Microbacterium protaetiae]|uniref:DUF5655 domain-containing protein n=1 Tax=Microbacterium protaetiae TaxID=2509458 RepID=A0A4P6EDM2_9MICO|nr:DUF5655 domain-containing protein [Microbacterium protaetiae]QAY60362.1 hypothetical protein ET475_10435 [Microbacterium protaetiae]
MATDVDEWTVERHMRAGSPETIALYERFSEILHGFGPIRIAVSKSMITFKGTRRGFAGAKPRGDGLVGYLDLMQPLPLDERIRSAAPFSRSLFVHNWRIEREEQFDDVFTGWLRDGYAVGCGAHLLR